jgi:hypothetical protein
MVVVALL